MKPIDYRLTTACPWYVAALAAGQTHAECVQEVIEGDKLDAMPSGEALIHEMTHNTSEN
jgi:hypothetical protein